MVVLGPCSRSFSLWLPEQFFGWESNFQHSAGGGNNEQPVADLAFGGVKRWRDCWWEKREAVGHCCPHRIGICSSPSPSENGRVWIANLLYRSFSTSPAPSMASPPVSGLFPAWSFLEWSDPALFTLCSQPWATAAQVSSSPALTLFSLPHDVRGPVLTDESALGAAQPLSLARGISIWLPCSGGHRSGQPGAFCIFPGGASKFGAANVRHKLATEGMQSAIWKRFQHNWGGLVALPCLCSFHSKGTLCVAQSEVYESYNNCCSVSVLILPEWH